MYIFLRLILDISFLLDRIRGGGGIVHDPGNAEVSRRLISLYLI